MRRRAFWVSLAAAALATSVAHADCQLTRVATLTTSPDQRPTIEVKVNGAQLSFVVDTGAEQSAVTPETVIALGLPRDRQRTTALTTIDGVQKNANVLLANLEIADQRYADRSVAVLPLGRLSSDRPLAGMVGADLLVDFDIEIDPPGRTLNLYHSLGCQTVKPPWEGRYQTIQTVTTERGRLLIPVEVDGHALTAMLDTGADAAVLSLAAAARLGVTDEVLARDPTGFGNSGGHGQARFWRHRFERLKIGAETFYDPVLAVGDFDLANADMLVGALYARTRRLFISYSTNTLFVQSEQSLVTLQNAVLAHPRPADPSAKPPAGAKPAAN